MGTSKTIGLFCCLELDEFFVFIKGVVFLCVVWVGDGLGLLVGKKGGVLFLV